MTESQRKLLSIAVPVLNEEENIDPLYSRLDKLSEEMHSECDFEFIFSDNNSDDSTWAMLKVLATRDERVKAVRFSKNFGFQRSILANYMHASGDAVVQVDADLQDPPELIKEFYERWEEGYDVVYGVRKQRAEGFIQNSFRSIGYWIINKLSEGDIPRDTGDFRLVDRKVLSTLFATRSATPYLRGEIANLGFRQIGIDYQRDARVAGASKFNLSRLMSLGLSAVFNHSTIPLRIGSYIGLFVTMLAILGAIYYVALRIFQPGIPPGLASIHILVLFGIGLNSFLLGLVGEYILRIYLLVRREPVAVIEDYIGFTSEQIKL